MIGTRRMESRSDREGVEKRREEERQNVGMWWKNKSRRRTKKKGKDVRVGPGSTHEKPRSWLTTRLLSLLTLSVHSSAPITTLC